MSLLLTALVVISAILMVGVILLQQGKGADLGAAFGRGAQGGLFGSVGAANFLTRTTKWLAVAFFGAALTLSLFVSDSNREGVLEELQRTQSESVLPDAEESSSGSDANSRADLDLDSGSGSDSVVPAAESAAEAAGEEKEENARTPD